MIECDVISITHSVIIEHGLPFSLLSVTPVASGWEIRVKEQHGGAVAAVSIPAGRATTIRVAIHDQLDALFNR